MNRRSRTLQSPKYLKKKRKKSIIKALLFIMCIVAFIIVMILVIRLPFLQIGSITVNGLKTLSSSEIEQKASANLSGYYFNFIPKSSLLFYSKEYIKNNLANSFKSIDKINIVRKNISNIEIDIEERIPVALACEGFHEQNDQNEDCFLVDAQGYVFSKSSQFSNEIYLKYYIVSDKGDNIIGTEFIDKKRFEELQKFIFSIKKLNIQPLGILIGEGGNYELYIKNSDQSEMIVYFNDRATFNKTLSNFLAFWNDTLIKTKSSNTAPVFDYIDLRFGNNVFYMKK